MLDFVLPEVKNEAYILVAESHTREPCVSLCD